MARAKSRRNEQDDDGPDVIEATCTEVKDEVPPAPELRRDDVLKAARALNSQVIGLAAAVEQAALRPGAVRPELLAAWRAWSGKFLADAARLEHTDPIDPQAEARRLAGYARRLGELRQAVAAELAPRPAPQVGQAEVAAPKSEAEPWSSAPRKWPWFIWMPVGFGAVVGAYMSVRWVFRKCMESIGEAGDREQSGEKE